MAYVILVFIMQEVSPRDSLIGFTLTIRTTNSEDTKYSQTLVDWYVQSSKERGTGIATRTKPYLDQKMSQGNAIIALDGQTLIGFCYIETFEGKKYVSNSGLIIHSSFRGQGIAKRIKAQAFQLARDRYPDAKIFGITTSDVVMKINTELGYRAVAFHQLTQDEAFWKGCSSCPNYDILMRNNKRMCLCTGMAAPSKNALKKSELL